MSELEKFMKSLDPNLIKKVQDFASTPKGEELVSRLSGKSKEALLKKVSDLSDDEKNSLLNKIKSDPSLISKIKELL